MMKKRILLAKRKNTTNSASKSGMFFHFAVKFEFLAILASSNKVTQFRKTKTKTRCNL